MRNSLPRFWAKHLLVNSSWQLYFTWWTLYFHSSHPHLSCRLVSSSFSSNNSNSCYRARESYLKLCGNSRSNRCVALFLSIMECAGEMQSAVEMMLALVTSSALFTLHLMESSVFWISSNSVFLCLLNCVTVYHWWSYFLSFADCSYGECPPAAAAEAAWHEAFTIPPCWA